MNPSFIPLSARVLLETHHYGPSPRHIPATARNCVRCELPPNLTAIRVLVVDDDRAAREMIAATLGLFGAHLTCAASGKKALELLDSEVFDVILSDIGMPECDGIEFMRRVRARRCPLPAGALTAYDSEDDLSRILGAGYDWYGAKPIEMAYLVSAVADLHALKTHALEG